MNVTWNEESKVGEYIARIGRLAARKAGETELVEALPEELGRVLDLGCGDGRLAAIVLAARPDVREVIGLDASAPMLERARERFQGDPRVVIRDHDLRQSLPDADAFDAVVSGFAIHHLSDERKQSLFVEIADALQPGGRFANLEVVQCATPELQDEFHRRIERPGGDPEDVLAPVETQLGWMRDAGFVQVDCYWRWRGFALLVGQAPASHSGIADELTRLGTSEVVD